MSYVCRPSEFIVEAVEGEERGFLQCLFFCPEDKATERERKGLAHYVTWQRDGWIITNPGRRLEHVVI